MKRHGKRQVIAKNWPVPRKGNTFVVRGNSSGLPILVILRDVLKLAKTRREVKKAIHKKDILICGKPVTDEKNIVQLFDTITIVPGKKHYVLTLSEVGKFDVKEVEEKDSKNKISKIIGKTSLKKNKNQINLSDGKNYISNDKCKVNDSVLIDLEKNKIKKIIPLKEKANILVIGGKHAGARGVIEKIIEDMKIVEVKTDEKKFNVLIKQLIILE